MDKNFLKYIKDKRGVALAVIALALGIILIFLGGRESDGEASGVTDVEERLAVACSGVDGVGECLVLVNYSPSGGVESVIVICDGADSVEVRSRLYGMISAFFGIGTNRIRVEKRRR